MKDGNNCRVGILAHLEHSSISIINDCWWAGMPTLHKEF